MPYLKPFNSIVTTTKVNNRYFGPTESQKMASFLSEAKSDIVTIASELNSIRDSYNALASGYLSPTDSGTNSSILNNSVYTSVSTSLDEVRRELYRMQQKVNYQIYTEGNQSKIF